jgi:hypothetical protein
VVSVNDPGGAVVSGLYRVDTNTGVHSLLSDFQNPVQGPMANDLRRVALEPSGHILVVAYGSVGGLGNQIGIFRVNAATGARTLLCDVADPAGGYVFSNVSDLAVGPSGRIYIAGSDPGIGHVVAQVDPVTGHRTVVSDLQDPTKGPVNLEGYLAVAPSGQILLATGTELLRIDPVSGQRVLVTDFESIGHCPFDIVLEGPGTALVLLGGCLVPGEQTSIWRVDLGTGQRALVSDFTDPAQGPTHTQESSGLTFTIELSQRVIAVVQDIPQDVLLRVSPVTGARQLLTPSWGGVGFFQGVAALTPPCLVTLGRLSSLNLECVQIVFDTQIGPWLIGCEVIDCCRFCPLDAVVDWVIQVESDAPGDLVILDVLRGDRAMASRALPLEGDGTWLRNGQLLLQPGRTVLHTPVRLAPLVVLQVNRLGWWHGGERLAERALRVSVAAFVGRRLIHAQRFNFEAPIGR